jgi:hypothetical protein
MARRVAIGLGLILFITVIVMIEHNGYADGSDRTPVIKSSGRLVVLRPNHH